MEKLNNDQANILLPPNRELTPNEEMYRDRFLDTMLNKLEYIPQENEVFCQMLSPVADFKAYNPRFFVSNYGTVLSTAREKIRQLKPSLNSGGKKVNNWDRLEREWTPYLRETYPQFKREMKKGHTPQCVFITNHFPKDQELGTGGKLPIHQLVALYFCKNGEQAFMRGNDVHHKHPYDWSKPQQASNYADNLQVLPHTRGHIRMHNITDKVIACTQDQTITINRHRYEVFIRNQGADYYAKSSTDNAVYHYHVVDGNVVFCELLKYEDVTF